MMGGGSPFFDPPEEPPPGPLPGPARPAWTGPPKDALGGLVPLRLVMLRGASFHLSFGQFLAYPTGIEFVIEIRWKTEPGDPQSHRLVSSLATGFGPPEEALRAGVRFSDGRLAATDRAMRDYVPFLEQENPAGPLLWPQGGHGSGERIEQRHWLWPLPPSGPLTFGIIWPAQSIPETTVTTDATPFIEAATRVEPLWGTEP
jgi:hypothetical protein